MPAVYGTRVGAAGRGRVGFAGWNRGGYGNLVVIKHRLGFESWYAHLSSIARSPDSRWSVGQRSATSARPATRPGHISTSRYAGSAPRSTRGRGCSPQWLPAAGRRGTVAGSRVARTQTPGGPGMPIRRSLASAAALVVGARRRALLEPDQPATAARVTTTPTRITTVLAPPPLPHGVGRRLLVRVPDVVRDRERDAAYEVNDGICEFEHSERFLDGVPELVDSEGVPRDGPPPCRSSRW